MASDRPLIPGTSGSASGRSIDSRWTAAGVVPFERAAQSATPAAAAKHAATAQGSREERACAGSGTSGASSGCTRQCWIAIRASPMSRRRILTSRSRQRRSSSRTARGVSVGSRAEIDVALQHVGQRVRDGLAVEEPLPREQLEEDHAERPDVGPLVDALAGRLFRRHVGRGAHDQAGLRGAHGEGGRGRRIRAARRRIRRPPRARSRGP